MVRSAYGVLDDLIAQLDREWDVDMPIDSYKHARS